ncbi:MAG TPA: IS1595 family transposase [Candidatus Binataceae bacterium]|nr:IS1595 family transposase [Candidatus Binataceae bacterium]
MRGDMFPLSGEVEIDETYVGGLNRNRHWDKKQDGRGPKWKTPVIGAIARKGNVVCKVIENASAQTMTRFVRQTVDSEVTLVATDEAAGYQKLGRSFRMSSSITRLKMVRSKVHTNNIESFWSLLKRGVIGTYL